MQEYLNKMKSLADNLHLVGCNFSQFDLFTQILNGLDSEYNPIVVQLLEKSELSWVEFQTSLLTFESRIEQIQSFQNLNLNSPTVNFAAFNSNHSQRSSNSSFDSKSNNNKINWRGSNSNRGGRARGWGRNSNGRPVYQICGKIGHLASVCYYRSYLNYMGSVPNQNKNSTINSPYNASAYFTAPETVTDPSWYLDNGASHHVTHNPNMMQQVDNTNGNTYLVVGNGHSLPVSCTGTTKIELPSKPLVLKNILHTPQIKKNLISVSQLTLQNNVIVEFDSDCFFVKDKSSRKILLQGKIKEGLYQFSPLNSNSAPQVLITEKQQNDVLNLHRSLGHPSSQVLS